MLNVFFHEFKRLCLNKTVQALSILSVLFTILLVYVVIANTRYGSYESPAYRSGLDAVAHARTVYAPSYGSVTAEKLESALRTYQDIAEDYPEGEIPDALREKTTAPLSPLLRLLSYTYETRDILPLTFTDSVKRASTHPLRSSIPVRQRFRMPPKTLTRGSKRLFTTPMVTATATGQNFWCFSCLCWCFSVRLLPRRSFLRIITARPMISSAAAGMGRSLEQRG